MPIRPGFMEILPYGYFPAFLTLLAAVVIGALWMGWGSPSPVEEKKKVDSVASPAKREEKEDARADVVPVPAALEKRDALTELVPTIAPMEKEKDALEKDDVCADIAPVPAATGKRVDLTELAPTSAPMEKEKDAPAVDLGVAHAVEGETKIHKLVENLAPTPVRMEKEKDGPAVELRAAHAVEGEKIHELVEEAGVASVTGEAGDLTVEKTSIPAENKNELNETTRPQAAERPEIGEMTLEELKAYDGVDAERPLLMAIKGQIYDVSKSRNLYGPGGRNELFGGRDASRALATMSFVPEDLTGNIDDLEEDDLEILGDWEQKFMEKYPMVGKLVAAVKTNEGKDKQAA